MTTRDSFETGGPDRIDIVLPVRRPRPRIRRLDMLLRSTAALGLKPVAAPSLVFVPIGILLGSHVTGLLTLEELAHLDAAVSVGLATLGVFVGLGLRPAPGLGRYLLVAASAEAALTMAVTGFATWFLLARWGLPLEAAPATVALGLALCASASSAGAAEIIDDDAHRTATEIAALDDVLPIVVGGVLIAAIGAKSALDASRLALITAGIGLLSAAAGSLLFERARNGSERLVFILGTIVLLAGASAYLSMSPLLAGLAAGAFWTFVPGTAGSILRDDLRKIQHPLVVILLILAGASVSFTRGVAWIVAPFVLFRMTGKLGGGWVASGIAGKVAPAHLGGYLVSPGVLGLAFALSLQQVLPATAGTLLVSAAALGSLAAELLALAVVAHDETDSASVPGGET